MILRPIVRPIVRPLVSALGRAARRAFSWRSLFADGTPGFRINVEEAIRLNQQAMGPELVVNGDFSDGTTGWTSETGTVSLSTSDGELQITGIGGNYPYATQSVPVETGKVYRVSWRLRSVSGAPARLMARPVGINDTTGQFTGSGNITSSAYQQESGFVTALGPILYLRLTINAVAPNTAGAVIAFDDISVREIDLSKCVAFQDSAGTLPVTAMEQPLGYIKDLSGNGNHFVQPDNTPSRPVVSRRVNLLTATETLATQSVTTLAASHVLAFSGTGSVTLSGAATGTYSAGTHTVTTTAGTLTVTVSGSVTNADLRLSIDANLPPYQRVTSPTDYDEVGFPAYARFDGVDDWLESGVVDMSSTDEVTVIAGVTKERVAEGLVFETSSSATNGSVTVSTGFGGPNNLFFASRGSTERPSINYNFGQMPMKVLLSCESKISAPLVSMRVNGSQVAANTGDQGTGNYGAHKAYIGRRGGSTLPFNGRIYGITVVGKLLDDSTLARAEQAERNLGRLY